MDLNDYNEVHTIFEPNYECAITASCFDDTQELFWTGNDEGRVTSYYSLGLSKYTSFRAQSGDNCDIKQISTHHNSDVFILTSDTLSNYTRLGTNNFKHKEVSFQNLQCMFLNQQERFFLAGFGDFIYDFDIERLRTLRQLSISDEQSDCILIKSSSPGTGNNKNGILCTGSSNGQIILRDPFSLKSIHKFHPHNGSLSDFDVHGSSLVSCGFSLTRNGNLCVDRFLMVYDLRMMRSLNPVQLHIEPCFIHFIPVCSSVVAVASQSGCFQLVDTNLMTVPSGFYQAQVPPGIATTFSRSSNSQSFAFGHSSGSVHLFSKGDNVLFNDYSEPTLFIEPPQFRNETYIDINHEMAPISSVPVPMNDDYLISDWPTKELKPEHRPTPKISSELIDNARIIHNIMSVPNRCDLKRNQVYLNEDYERFLKEIEENSVRTSVNLEEFVEVKKDEN